MSNHSYPSGTLSLGTVRAPAGPPLLEPPRTPSPPDKLKQEARELLSSQLSRISGILADAAKHRDKLVREKMSASQYGSDSAGAQSPIAPARSDRTTGGSITSKQDDRDTADSRPDVSQMSSEAHSTNAHSTDAKFGDGDPRQMLAEMERERQAMLFQFDRDTSSATIAPFHDDPVQLLAGLDRDSQCIMTSLHSSDTPTDDLDNLRVEFESLRATLLDNSGSTSSATQRDAPAPQRRVNVPSDAHFGQGLPGISAVPEAPTAKVDDEPYGRASQEALDTELIPYVAALKLEIARCDWAKVLGWTKYLFSNGADGHKARQAEKEYAQKCEEEISELVEDTLRRMSLDHVNISHLKNGRRIVVTNIAADAGVYDLAVVFDEFEITDITILKERHPLNRTRAAYIDFHDTQTAWAASRVIDYIFGLRIRIRLASEIF